jgi:hypothetical protein
MDKKENTFAKEVQGAKVSPAEEMNRNQAVHLLTLRSEKRLVKADEAHLLLQRGRLSERKRLMASMLDCECKTASMAVIDQRIAKIGEAIEASQFNGVSEMTLDALERLAALTLDACGATEAINV